MKKLLPVITFILIIAAVSVICVMFNNLIFVGPRDNALLNLNGEMVDVLAKHNGNISMLQSDVVLLQDDVNHLQSMEITNHNVLKGTLFILQINNKQIEELENNVKELKKRHMELLRAIAILQKMDWPLEKRFESSGIDIGSLKYSEPSISYKNPEPKVIIENIEKELENW